MLPGAFYIAWGLGRGGGRTGLGHDRYQNWTPEVQAGSEGTELSLLAPQRQLGSRN